MTGRPRLFMAGTIPYKPSSTNQSSTRRTVCRNSNYLFKLSGGGSKSTRRGYPGFHFGTGFLSHSHLAKGCKNPCPVLHLRVIRGLIHGQGVPETKTSLWDVRSGRLSPSCSMKILFDLSTSPEMVLGVDPFSILINHRSFKKPAVSLAF